MIKRKINETLNQFFLIIIFNFNFNYKQDVVIKTMLVAMPHLFHAYHMCRGGDAKGSSCCFEVLGFDVFIDRKYKPWVIEVRFLLYSFIFNCVVLSCISYVFNTFLMDLEL